MVRMIDFPVSFRMTDRLEHVAAEAPAAPLLPAIPALEMQAMLEAERTLGRLDQLLAEPDARRRYHADAARREALASARLDNFLVRWDELVLVAAGPGLAPIGNRAATLHAYDIWRATSALQSSFHVAPGHDRGETGDDDDDVPIRPGLPLSVDLVEEVFRRSQLVSSGRAPESLCLTAEQRAAVAEMLSRIEQAMALPGLLGAAMAVQALHQVQGLERPGLAQESPRDGQGDPSLRRYMVAHPARPLDWRLARLLAPALLAQACGLRHAALWLSPAIAADSTGYRRLVGAPPAQWVLWFAGRVRVAAEDACRRTADLATLAERWRQRIGKRRASSRIVAAAEHLFDRPLVSARAIQRHLELSPRGAQLIINELSKLGIMRTVDDRASDRLFVADAMLR